jgi:hypothetical protein
LINTTKPYPCALSLSDLKIGLKLVVFKIVDTAIELDGTSDSLAKTLTVISTDYTAGTATCHGFEMKAVVTPLTDLGIPSLESGDAWRDDMCAVKLEHARELINKAVNAKRDADSISPKRARIDWTLPISKQMIGLST